MFRYICVTPAGSHPKIVYVAIRLSLLIVQFGMCSATRQDGTGLNDTFKAAAASGGDGSVILAGSSSGNWSGVTLGEMDFIAIKLDSDGNEMWRWQVWLPV